MAEQHGMPPDIAEAVAAIESGYRPDAVGAVGEVGLMQIRPETAAMLGYKGEVSALFDPEVNVRYSVTYLAGAWRKADGDLCRTLMKYRAGHGTEYMTALSATYCGRARSYLAGIGSPIGEGASPVVLAPVDGPLRTSFGRMICRDRLSWTCALSLGVRSGEKQNRWVPLT